MSNDIRELHTCARWVWIALALFGHPEQIMRHGFILPPAYRDLSNWLRHLVRRILLVIALGIPSVPYQPRGAGRTSGAHTRVLLRRTRPPWRPCPVPGPICREPSSVAPGREGHPSCSARPASPAASRRYASRSCIPKFTQTVFRARSCAASPTRRSFRPASASGGGVFLPGAGASRPWRSNPKS